MFAHAASIPTQHPFGHWSLLFARQPEPDLDFEEDLAEDTQQIGGQSPGPGKPPKKKGTSPLLWILLLALIGIGGYFAVDPDGFMVMINTLTGEPAQPVAQAPPRPMPAPPVASTPPPSSGSGPAAPSTTPPPTMTPSPAPTPAPMAPAPSSATTPVTSAPLAQKSTTPLFAEGQRVTVSGLGSMTLSQNAAGSAPGPSVKPGSILIVLDGELQAGGWMYQVRTEAGAKGWVTEKQLRVAP